MNKINTASKQKNVMNVTNSNEKWKREKMKNPQMKETTNIMHIG